MASIVATVEPDCPSPAKEMNEKDERRNRRTIFSFEDWKRHRSNGRFIRHVATIADSGIIRGVRFPVLCVTLFSAVVAMYNHLNFLEQLPLWMPPPPRIAIDCLGVTSFALGLLLVFRTNASYARWIEARRAFGAICTVSRDALTWFKDEDRALQAKLCRWLIALAKCSMMHLRSPEEHNLQQELGQILQPDEIELLVQSGHKPTCCIQVVTYIINESGLERDLIVRMDSNLSEIVIALSTCERILNTPIPLSYTRHTGRFLMFWMVVLPFSLWQYCGWAMVCIMGLISFVLLGIEEIGVYIEEPFSLLPLEALSNRLAFGLNSMQEDHGRINSHFRSPNF
eukprot:gene31302-6450_t